MSTTRTRAPLTPGVRVKGQALPDTFLNSLLSLTVTTSVHTAGEAKLSFDDPLFKLFDQGTFLIGDEVEIKAPDKDGSLQTVFKGKVTGVGIEDEYQPGKASVPRLTVEARDGSQSLASSATYQAYNTGAKDVVSAIASRHGLTAAVVGTPEVKNYVIQTGTDHAMLTELARRTGYEWFTDGEKLHFRPRPAPSGPALSRSDGTLLRFAVHYSGLATPKKVEVHGWDGEKGEAHKGDGASALSGGAADLGSDAPFVKDQYTKAKSSFGQTLTVGDPASRDAKEAAATATGVARELVGAGLRAEGTARSNPAVKAGSYVKVEDMGSKLSGSYYVTEVRHEFAPGQEMRTTFTSGGHEAEPAGWAAGFGGDSWAGRGPVVGVVSNLNDDKKLGRVKVKFPSLGDVESDWARVVSAGAGQFDGLDFRPEIDDEVVVVFERGDPRFPLVLGGVWNGKRKPPRTDLVASGKVNSRIIRFGKDSGHFLQLEFADADTADGTVSITLGNDTVLSISETDGVKIDVKKGDLEFITKGGSIKLTESGDLTMDVKGMVAVKAKKDVNVDAKMRAEVKAASGVTVDGGAKFEIKGVDGKVEAKAPLILKGAIVKVN